MERSAKVLLYVLGAIEELMDAGLVEGPRALSAKGKIELEKLKAQGFEPTVEEIEAYTAYLAKYGPSLDV